MAIDKLDQNIVPGKFFPSNIERLSERAGINCAVLGQIQELARRYHLERLFLFGSRSRGDFHTRSDIDLAAAGGEFSEFALSVQEETDTLLRFDIVNLDAPVQKDLLNSIIKEGILIYEKV